MTAQRQRRLGWRKSIAQTNESDARRTVSHSQPRLTNGTHRDVHVHCVLHVVNSYICSDVPDRDARGTLLQGERSCREWRWGPPCAPLLAGVVVMASATVQKPVARASGACPIQRTICGTAAARPTFLPFQPVAFPSVARALGHCEKAIRLEVGDQPHGQSIRELL